MIIRSGNMEREGVIISYKWTEVTAEPIKIAILLPDIDYPLQGPLFWYTNQVYMNEKFDTLQVQYFFQGDDKKKLPSILSEIIHSFLQKHKYDFIHLVSMGLGSTIAASFLTHQLYTNINAVWYSPHIHQRNVLQVLLKRPYKGLVFIGSDGELIMEENVHLLEGQEHLTVGHVDGGDDSFEWSHGDIENINIVKSIMQTLRQFIKTGNIELVEEKTSIRAYFSLYGDDFPLEEVTEKLGIQPTDTEKKGDEFVFPNGMVNPNFRHYKETRWQLSTEIEESVDLEVQMNQIVDKLYSKIFAINELQEKYQLKCYIQIVLSVENGLTPGFTFSQKVINFAQKIKAEFIDVDMYVSPYDDKIQFQYDGINFKNRRLE